MENRLDTALVYCVFIHYYYLLYMVPTLSTSIPAVLVYSVYGTYVNSISEQCIYSITEVCILVQKLDTPTTTLCKIILYSPLPIFFPKWLYFFEMLLLLRLFPRFFFFSFFFFPFLPLPVALFPKFRDHIPPPVVFYKIDTPDILLHSV